MFRHGWPALLLSLAACGESVDDRPLELEYLTQAIFSPSCGTTQCHSTFRQVANNVFDTPEGTRRAIVDNGLVVLDSTHYDPDDPEDADLIHWITDIAPFDAKDANGDLIGRMPRDAPLPNKDVLLLKEWIAAGVPGAECNPDANAGQGCWRDVDVASSPFYVGRCNADWTIDTTSLIRCNGGCIQGVCQ